MIRLAFIVGLGLTGAACASAAPGSSTAAHLYRCEGGKSFTAAYGRGRALVTVGGVTRTLPLARSASGARYATGDSELWGKGDSATLKGFAGGPYDGCVTR